MMGGGSLGGGGTTATGGGEVVEETDGWGLTDTTACTTVAGGLCEAVGDMRTAASLGATVMGRGVQMGTISGWVLIQPL